LCGENGAAEMVWRLSRHTISAKIAIYTNVYQHFIRSINTKFITCLKTARGGNCVAT
jgi:hypothetical protein